MLDSTLHTQAPLQYKQQITRLAAIGDSPEVLAEAYQEHINLAIWQRDLAAEVADAVAQLLVRKPTFKSALTLTPQNAEGVLVDTLGDEARTLAADVAEVIDMFCCLFELQSAGFRMAAMHSAMCPRFHVDRVPCRLVSTYSGVATEWLSHSDVNRALLGRGGDGLTDLQAGLYASTADVQQVTCGDVALLKGELWIGNEGAGLVHRSPEVPHGQSRLVLTLDVGN